MVRIKLEIFNTSFIVHIIDQSLNDILSIMTDELSTFSYIFNKDTKRTIRERDKTYFSHLAHIDSYRFSIQSLKDFMLLLNSRFVAREEISAMYFRHYDVDKIDININSDFVLRDYQHTYINAITEETAKKIILIDLSTGRGKASSIDSLVRIPDGWKRMGDIKVDDNVIAKDGTITKVTAVYPQGKKDLYKITFYDGRTHEACGEHLWKVYSPYFKDGNKVINTYELIHRIKNKDKADIRYYIDLPDPEKNADKDFKIHPYLMGIILGDGSISQNNIKLTVSDPKVIERADSLLDSEHYISKDPYNSLGYTIKIKPREKRNSEYRNKYIEELGRLSLMGTRSYDKFIPIEYLNGSEEQRYELLRGLLDTDGDVGVSGSTYYSTSSKKLSDGFIELVRSLGGIVTHFEKIPFFTYKDLKIKGRISYRHTIRMKQPRRCLTRESRLCRLKESNQYSDTLKLRINKIEYVGKKEAQCISIEHEDKLYITGDYVVTHNTLITLAAISKLNMKTAVLIKPKYVDKTVIDIKRYTDAVDSDIYVVQGEESLQYLIDNGNSYKFVIFSTATLGNLISDYESYHSYSLSIPPYELLKHLKIGIVYNDETHEEFHRVFKILLYLNPLRVIGSSATLLTAQADVNKMYNVLFPTSNRISNIIGLDNYVNIVAVNYKLTSGQGIRFKGPKGYSHIMYEQSIMRNNILMNGYIDMINTYIKESYITKRLPGDKIVIFVSTIRMASVLCNHFAKVYKEFDVRRYVEDDPFSNLMDSEMCFTTQLSAGTAVDIPNLISVIQTVSTSSIQANMQNKGRLREIKGREVYYYYLYTTFIDKQKQYHFDRMKAIRPSSKTYTFVEYPVLLRVR
jgi:hypothetical protein